ncbi:MAG: Mycothiol acetyltransferase [Candidatus Heimdallarchaeota archaeon LC_2]|nr:MAG: Mycothiol acetyltransferase [Candidatus Heimdallarchaeota archaeon LC_2]
MISTEPALSNAEMGHLIAILTDTDLVNDLIIADIHAPMNQISDIYKLIDEDELVSGWSIFNGYQCPIIVFPPTFPQGWDAIRSCVNDLNFKEIMVVFPKIVKDNTDELPWEGWDHYEWNYLGTDISMKFEGDVDIYDISNLPKMRGITYEERDIVTKFLEQEEKTGDFAGIYHPLQIKSDLYIVAEDNEGTIMGVAGTHYETPHSVQLGNIYVKKEYRNQGIGRALTSAVTLSIRRSHRLATLFVNENNLIAQKLYEDIGFEKFNQYDFYKGTLKEI